jgi:epoxyqueuosine reductase QueG
MDRRVREEIVRFLKGSPYNTHTGCEKPYFDEPLVGFASASDPIFKRYKEIIGDFHLTPAEFFEKTFSLELTRGTVICWILPISRHVRESNRAEAEYPSLEWARTRTHGETCNDKLREHLVAFLASLGHRAVAPMISPVWKQFPSTPVGIASSWSERHAAYAAGLGTFSLNDGLITERGIAHRCGSVITDLLLPPSPVPVRSHTANCLFSRDGSCGRCIGRCPAGAITEAGHHKEKCRQYVYERIPSEVGYRYDVNGRGCGLCQTNVPCEERIPAARDLSKRIDPEDAA